jgi:hypothetical protein
VSEPGAFLRALHTRGVRTVQFEGSSETDIRRYPASRSEEGGRSSPPAADGSGPVAGPPGVVRA